MTATDTLAPGARVGVRSSSGMWRVYRAEGRKLSTQLAIRLLALLCALGPFAFAAILKAQSGLPADTLFGVWAHTSGFAVPLVVLGFAGSWGFPVVAGIVAGDIFSSEDRYGTWKTVLTRSCTREQLFVGKVLAAATFSIALMLVAAISSIVAGLVLVGDQSLVSLSGTLFSPGRALALVVASWLFSALPVLAFTSMAVLFSVATRNGIIGVMGPSVVGLVMQLLALVGTGVWVHALLVGSAFDGWHGLFTARPYFGQLTVAAIVSVLWMSACLGGAWAILRGRDYAGPPAPRRSGWALPLRVAVISAGLIAFLAVASNWGPVGVTAPRLKAAITPTFNKLTLLQQHLLGRPVPRMSASTSWSSCSRRARPSRGPGDDCACTLDVLIPQPGAVPFQQTPVTYDVSVKANGCYKADAPPSFVGQQTMRAASGHTTVNPLFTIYGCFNTL